MESRLNFVDLDEHSLIFDFTVLSDTHFEVNALEFLHSLGLPPGVGLG
ncbi:MAG: hypothetical protein ACHP8A_13240 [Terriglobales bacterium]